MKIITAINLNAVGGEFNIMKNISKITNSDLVILFDSEDKRIHKTISEKILKRIYEKTHVNQLKNLILLIYPYFTKVYKTADLIIFSTSGNLIPRGKNIIAFVHTPPRFFSDYYDQYLDTIKGQKIIKLMFPYVKNIYNIIYRHNISKAKLLISNSKNIQMRLKKYYNLNSIVLYEGICVDSFYNSGFENYFLAVSRFEPAKNFEFILRSFKIFQKSNDKFKLKIAGAVKDGSSMIYLKKLKEFINDNNLNVDIIINPDDTELKKLYANAYSFLFSAINEDFGLVLLEAMASGKPVISINCGGPKEIIKNGYNGFLVNDETEMANKMFFFVQNPEMTKIFGQNGRFTAVEKFSMEAFKIRLYDVLTKTSIGEKNDKI